MTKQSDGKHNMRMRREMQTSKARSTKAVTGWAKKSGAKLTRGKPGNEITAGSPKFRMPGG